MKPEKLDHFIRRMAGRDFTDGDIATCCGIDRDRVSWLLKPYMRAGRVASLNGTRKDETINFYRAIPAK